jgi:hypothetical protein
MKNQAERREYLENEDNWTPVEVLRNVRVSQIKYKGEKRYKLETFEVITRYDYHDRKSYNAGEWVVRGYYKTPENPEEIITNAGDRADLLEPQSVTQPREWLADLDKKGTGK